MTEPWPEGPKPPERTIDWTGERCVPWAQDYQVVYEHYHRYAFVRPFVAGKRVVDLASGEGYGARLMAEVASWVVGVDIDEPSIRHARATYRHPRLEFRAGSMLELDVFGAQRFDCVVCFEALEHVGGHEDLLRVVTSILEPGGILVISTPDTEVYTGQLHNENPFHVRELTRSEFSSLLSSYFGHVTVLGQTTVVGSSIRPDRQAPVPTDVLELRPDEDGWDVGPGTTRPTYLLAVASDGELPTLDASLLFDPELHLVGEPRRRLERLHDVYAEVESQRVQLEAENARARTYGQMLEDRMAQLQGELQSVAEALTTTEDRVRSAERELAERDAVLAAYEDAVSVQLAVKLAGYADRLLPPDTHARRNLARLARRVLGRTGER